VNRRALCVRLDSAGDVLLCGPAIRAVAETCGPVTLLCGPRGAEAARLLPGVGRALQWSAPWIDADPPPVRASAVDTLIDVIRSADVTDAVIFTSFHQSALPTALLLRLGGVARIAAISEDYPGSLLDVRHTVAELLPEPERALSLAAAAGFPLPVNDDGRLQVLRPLPVVPAAEALSSYVVVHPGAAVPARACPPDVCGRIVDELSDHGWTVVVTGGPDERDITASVAGSRGLDLGGRTSLAELGSVLSGAAAVVVGNTGPAHLAAAVGSPVVSLYAPTVPYEKWGPYGVPAIRLGQADAPCRDTRARICPVPGHPCLSTVDPAAVAAAVTQLAGARV
jgi:ADP-heptose:LPS heptosyltransferase